MYREKKFKRMLALLLATVMTGSGIVADSGLALVRADELDDSIDVTAESNEVDSESTNSTEVSLIANFDFEGLEPSQEMHGGGAKASGSYSLVDSYYSGKALSIDGKNQFISITNEDGSSLLTGVEEMTLSADVNFGNAGKGWLFYVAPNTDAQSYPYEHYIGALNGDNTLKVERYNNNGSRPLAPAPALGKGAWAHIELVFTKEDVKVYINGEMVKSEGSSYALPDILGSNSIFYLGRANWGSGEYGNLLLDNFQIYNGVLSDDVIREKYNEYIDRKKKETVKVDFSINAGYVTDDINLIDEYDGKKITWESSDETSISSDGKVTRKDENKEVILKAKIEDIEKEFKVVVLKKGADVISFVSNAPAVGQNGGMLLAAQEEEGYKVLHKHQPVMYTAKGQKAYVAPTILRKASGDSFFMVAADGVSGKLLVYDSNDLTTYENEREVNVESVTNIKNIAAFYDMSEERYEIYLKADEDAYLVTSKDMVSFEKPICVEYEFDRVENAPGIAINPSKIGLTIDEYNRVVTRFSNPYNTSVSNVETEEIVIETGTTAEELNKKLEEYLKNKTVTAEYSDGTQKTFGLRFTKDSVEKLNTGVAGTYTLDAVIGGSANYTNPYDEAVLERADPYCVFNEDDGYYYFTGSYPMYSNSDADGYDRIVLRRAKTISGLANAEEVTIWDENQDAKLGRFIWAPEMHKIGNNWYLVATAGLNSGTGTTFDIRPFMIKFNGDASKDDMFDTKKWGDPVLVKAYEDDKIVAGMSLDMTYFEANGNHYLIWADETKNTTNPAGESYLYIASIDPSNPTQLTSKAMLLTKPEYSWELVRYHVNEGPGVFKKGGKVYMTFSASGTGSEYCVGLMYADEKANLLDISNWTKLPYPILTSADFDDEVSGPGHNSFTYDEYGNLVIVYHARITETHNTHTGDSLYDPCRYAYVKSVFFDTEGLPIFNMSKEQFLSCDETIPVTVKVVGESKTFTPMAEYKFDEEKKAGIAKDSTGNYDAKLHNGATYEKDSKYGQVLYLNGAPSYGGTNAYLEFPQGMFDGKDKVTISFDVNQVTREGNYFTFTLGQDNNKYLFYKAMATAEKLAITKNGANAEKKVEANAKYPNTSREWINITIVVDGKKLSLYRNGKLIGTQSNTDVTISDLGKNITAYLGKSYYPADQYFRGYFDNVKVFDTAFTTADVLTYYTTEQTRIAAEASELNKVADDYVIPNMNDIRGNISLPSEINGVKVTWQSSNEDVISTKEVVNENYDNMPAGVVTRQDVDTQVVLTAKFEKGNESVTKKYDCLVKAMPTELDDFAGYLFVHFTGTEGTADCEQVYFSVSKDGLNWKDLNNNKPVLTSTIGESGLRDMYIARTPEQDKFYMISTDLSIFHRNNWGEAGSNGSHSIVVWESTDLVNWSEPWLAEIAPKNAGCTWAPEFIYDEKTGEYIVYWASTTLEVDSNEKVTQDYENHAIYYAKTRDFVHFSETKPYHSGGRDSSGKIIKVIDSTMIENNGTYYRYTKNESVGSIAIDKADSVLGEFTDIPSPFLKNDVPNRVGAVEGPIIFKLNEKTTDGKDQWCLYVDRYGTGSGYYPVVTSDLESGEFKFLDNNAFNMPSKYRHGYVMPITKSEYEALCGSDWEKWEGDAKEVTLSKSTGNPFLGFDAEGNKIFGGDPSILVDGDTVYAYVGHDVSTNDSYNMPEWLCYSSKDMVNWKYEGPFMSASRSSIKWANDDSHAWAGQVMKHGDKYYFYYCCITKSGYGPAGSMSIGVAVSDSPTGGFVDIGKPLVTYSDTEAVGCKQNWENIDPTAWIEVDESGVEHRYLGWGNTAFFNCELNEDMISIKDKDGNPNKLSVAKAVDNPNADIKIGVINNMVNDTYTEAPYYYRQQDAYGNYYGKYYMFFACDWREQMAYATCDTREQFENNEWTFGGVIMEPSATANTNHMAVFDFKGQSYFVYHDGALSNGSGYRRSACVEKFSVNADGSIPYIAKTAVGISGKANYITDLSGNYIAVEKFENSISDGAYPMTNKDLKVDFYSDEMEAEWEINPGKSNPNKSSYVSIESNYKPGLYITVGNIISDGVYEVVLSQDVRGTEAEAKAMTFRTIEGLNGTGISFESVAHHGYFLANVDGKLLLMNDPDNSQASFVVKDIEKNRVKTVEKARVEKTKRMFFVGDTFVENDLRVQAILDDGKRVTINDVKVDSSKIDMSKIGTYELKVGYVFDGQEYEETLAINVVSRFFMN